MSVPKPNTSALTFIPLTFSPGHDNASATHLILTLFPDWKASDLKFIRFTDGITNTLLKCVHTTTVKDETTGEERSYSDETESLLIRAYGKGTNVLIDRNRGSLSSELDFPGIWTDFNAQANVNLTIIYPDIL